MPTSTSWASRTTLMPRRALCGVSVREDFTECDDEEEGEGDEDEGTASDRWTARASELPSNDVFILEGESNYGTGAARPGARGGRDVTCRRGCIRGPCRDGRR